MINAQNPTQTWNVLKSTQHHEVLDVPSSPKKENQILNCLYIRHTHETSSFANS